MSFGLASPKPDLVEQFVECCSHTTDDRVTKFSIGEHNDSRMACAGVSPKMIAVYLCMYMYCMWVYNVYVRRAYSTDTVQTCVTFGAV